MPRHDASDLIDRRVRVRLVPGRICEDAPHAVVEEGQTGTVVRCDDPVGARPHPLLVRYDMPLAWPISAGGVGRTVSLPVQRYTADEVELLDGP